MKAIQKVMSFLALMLLVVPAAVLAAPTFTSEVKVNGHEMLDSETLELVRGDSIDLDLAVTAHDVDTANNKVEDLRWRAWIGGYEVDIIEARSSMFDLTEDVTKLSSLTLQIPSDLEASDEYTLHVELVNGNVEYEFPVSLLVTRDRHRVDVQDVLVSPSTSVNAGDSVFVTVRLENMGDRKEEDLKVTVSAFGQSASTYVNELAAFEIDNEDEESSDSSNALLVRVPRDAATGDYPMSVEVSYNRGRDTVSATKVLHVAGKAQAGASVDALVSVDSSAQTVAQNGEVSYRVSFANVGSETQVFSVRATGTQLWADARAEPSFVTVAPGQTGEVVVYLKAHSDAEAGNKLFTLQILAGDKPVKELAVGAKVTEAKPAQSGSALNDLLSTSTLKLGFVALVVLLVIVGLVLALRKLKEDDDYPLEPKDGQTYY